MSNLQRPSRPNQAPQADKQSQIPGQIPERQKSDKLWISAALAAVLLGFSAGGANAEDGLLGGVGNTVNGITSSLTNTVNGLGSGLDGSSNSAGLNLASATDIKATAGDKSLDASLDADVNAAAQRSGEGLGLQGLATHDTASSVNLSGVDQATSAHVTNNGSIVLN